MGYTPEIRKLLRQTLDASAQRQSNTQEVEGETVLAEPRNEFLKATQKAEIKRRVQNADQVIVHLREIFKADNFIRSLRRITASEPVTIPLSYISHTTGEILESFFSQTEPQATFRDEKKLDRDKQARLPSSSRRRQ